MVVSGGHAHPTRHNTPRNITVFFLEPNIVRLKVFKKICSFNFCLNSRCLFIEFMRAKDSSLPPKPIFLAPPLGLERCTGGRSLRKPGRLSPWCHECVAGEIQHRQLVGAAARVSSASVQVKAHSRDREQRPEVTAELIRSRRRRSLCWRKPLSRSRLRMVIYFF